MYLPVVDLHAEAMQVVAHNLHKEYGIGESAEYLVLVGDQKTYARICELKQEYGAELVSFHSLVTGTFSPSVGVDVSIIICWP